MGQADMVERPLRRFLVPGTFDPVTRGHLDVIERATRLCDEVVVAVAESRSKRGGPVFPLERRLELVQQAIRDIPRVRAVSFTGLLMKLAHDLHATAVVKGLRAMTDFEYELQQANLNYVLDPQISAIYVMSGSDYSFVSSSAVREIARMGGELSPFVTPEVERALREVYGPMTWQAPPQDAPGA